MLSPSEGSELNLFLSSLSWPLRRILPAGTGTEFCCGGRSRVWAATSPGAFSAFCAEEAAPSRAGERSGGWRGPRHWRCGRQSRRRGSSTCPSSALLLFSRGQGRCSMLCAREPGSSVAWAAPGSRGGARSLHACTHVCVSVCPCALCAHVARVCSWDAVSSLNGFARLWARRSCRWIPGAVAGPGKPGVGVASTGLLAASGSPVPSAWLPTSRRGSWLLGPAWTQHNEFPGSPSRGKRGSGEAAFSSKASSLRRKSQPPSRANCSICAFRSLKIHSILPRSAWPARLTWQLRTELGAGADPAARAGEGLGAAFHFPEPASAWAHGQRAARLELGPARPGLLRPAHRGWSW